jgi:hypothetical protein
VHQVVELVYEYQDVHRFNLLIGPPTRLLSA